MSRRITVVRRVGVGGGGPSARGGAAAGRLLRAAGAVVAQFSQAVTSLLFGVLGLRVLSAGDFGLLGLLLGGTVVATAVMTGFVGDSLTVLDRRRPAVRAALLQCAAGLAVLLLAAAALATWGLGVLPAGTALLFGAAVAAFVLEDSGRRLLMANLRFWHVVAVDVAYAGAAGAVLVLRAARAPDELALEDFLLALLVGLLVALAVALRLLPPEERSVPWQAAADLRLVAAYGSWRALQQVIRPAALTLVRSLVLAASGAVALATFEAGRLYVSPALLLMQGAGSFLLARNAVERAASTRQALRRADVASATLAGAGLAAGGALVVLLPWLGPLLTGGSVIVSATNVLAWTCLAAASGLSMPYGTLATVRVRPQLVLLARVADTVVALAAVVLVVLVLGAASPLLPLGLAVGWATSAVLQRQLVARGGPAPATGGDGDAGRTGDRVVQAAAGSRGAVRR